ncbi:MAG: FAD-binding protein [Chitinophagaceae bacterium]|jgi:hypothetical protein|nr:FAD-binding protein [Chitinophagaceae bacterium]
MNIFKTGYTQWENRHETFQQNIKNLYALSNISSLNAIDAYNDTTKGLQGLIQEAIDNNTTLRALGAGWSWTKIATVNNGIMLDTKALNARFYISKDSVNAAYTGDADKLIFAQCGCAIWELSQELKMSNLSLKTSGASNGQTVAGLIGTGAHGSAFDFGAAQEFVVGLHIVTGPNTHVYLERSSYPVISDAFAQKLNAQIIRDDDIFNSALVSMGAFGIVHGVMIETEPIYLLEAYMRRMPYDSDLQNIMQTLDFSNTKLPYGNERPFHFAVMLNPYDMTTGAYVTTMYKRNYTPDYTKPVNNMAGIGPGDDAPCFIGNLTSTIPATIPMVVNALLSSALTPYEKQFGILSEIFDNTTLHGKVLSAAVGFPIQYVNKVIDLLLQLNNEQKFTGLFAFRYIKKSKAKLAFTRYDYTCVLELDSVYSSDTLNYYHNFWQILDNANIPYAFHWGKMTELDSDKVKKIYGADLDTWLASRNKILSPQAMKVFTNPIMQEWGLDKIV